MERQIVTDCGNCWFCKNGQCTYGGVCTYSKKWDSNLQSMVPESYEEEPYLFWE